MVPNDPDWLAAGPSHLRKDNLTMKQDRFLTGILIGITVLIIAALAIFFTRKDNLNYVSDDTPAGVVQNYVVAIHKHDYERAYSYLANLPNRPSVDLFRKAFLNHLVDPTNVGLEIGKTEISGTSATVSLGIIFNPNDPFSNGYRNTDFAQLVNQNSAWKINQLPGSFWAYDWYQPNTIPAVPVK
jgi:hypothetical protein